MKTKDKTKTKGKVPKSTKVAIKEEVKHQLSKIQETKQHAYGIGYTAFYSGVGRILQHMTNITQGTGDTQRIGDEITLKHCYVSFSIQNNSGAAAQPFTDARVIVFQYNSNDITPNELELLLGAQATAGAISSYSARNIDYLGVYNVLYDKTFHLSYGVPNANNYAQTDSYSVWKKVKIPLKYAKKKLQYMNGVGTNESTNGLYLFVTSGNGIIAANPTFAAEWVVSYTDS